MYHGFGQDYLKHFVLISAQAIFDNDTVSSQTCSLQKCSKVTKKQFSFTKIVLKSEIGTLGRISISNGYNMQQANPF